MGSTGIRQRLAGNPNCPVEVVRKLSEEKDPFVRGILARNPGCPVDVLNAVANDDNVLVRFALLSNPNCPPMLCLSLFENIT